MAVIDMLEALQSEPAPVPAPTPTSPVSPIPTVIPGDTPILQEIHDEGKRTLWYFPRPYYIIEDI